MVEFRVLGPLEIRDASGRILVPKRRKTRTLLAILLLRANTLVPADELLEALWEERRPASARANLQSYVSELRRLLDESVSLNGNGYLLTVEESRYDAAVFEKLVTRGRQALTAARFREATGHLGDALAMWRGELLDGLPLPQWLWPDRSRLEELRLSAYEDSVTARLALGQHEDLVAGLREFTGRNPFREPAWGLLMLSLHRCGRTAEAVDAYQTACGILDDELGVPPNPELRALHERILNEDPGLLLAPEIVSNRPQAAPTPRQIPAGVVDFVGRTAYLRALDDLFPASPAGGRASVFCALTGTGGVGKTALSVHWANHAADRFPDGQLYVDLRGFTPSTRPLHPLDALAQFLRSLGVPAEQVPLATEEASALYRSLLAGRRTLVLLDNAFDGAQVRPLLPPLPSCALITSRDRLDSLVLEGVRRITVEVMPREESRELVERITGAECEGLAEFCGHLPLALRLAATQIVSEPGLSVSAYLGRLGGEDRLSALDGDIDRRHAIRSTFEASYRRLPYEARRLLRALGAVPGPDFTPAAAAAMLGADQLEVEPLLRVLWRSHLVHGGEGDRFALHDLLRLYALERFAEEEPEAEQRRTRERLALWYLRHTRAASELICPQMVYLPLDLQARPSFDSEASALSWLEAELNNVVALAEETGGRTQWLLVDALRGYWYLRRHSSGWMRHAMAGLASAEAAGDHAAQAAMRSSLADAHMILGDRAGAFEHHTAVLELSRKAGWLESEAAALGRLGTLHISRGEPREASGYYLRAIESNRRLGVYRGMISNLGNLGLTNIYLGNLDHAAEQLGEALRCERERSSAMGEALGLGNLGVVSHHRGDLDLALSQLGRAVELFESLRSDYGAVDALSSLAAVHNDLGDPVTARALAVRARDLARTIGDGKSETSATNALGAAARGDSPEKALRLHERALELALAKQLHYDITQTHIELAVTHGLLGDTTASTRHASHALVSARRSGFRRLEGYALLALGDGEAAGRMFEEIGDALGLARARRGVPRQSSL
ncbi:AfsR/SARP family transcriptional regulator [Streptosporangium carneum]|uniref:AfsR/SARP family transcriptional regulator n=1 Tax=Streptosporangium carneum TaxID=47481 RepID=UPI0022F2AE05|nr:BTAD domain-containing putative transcriptional regulator [Streptosporangium carneum]